MGLSSDDGAEATHFLASCQINAGLGERGNALFVIEPCSLQLSNLLKHPVFGCACRITIVEDIIIANWSRYLGIRKNDIAVDWSGGETATTVECRSRDPHPCPGPWVVRRPRLQVTFMAVAQLEDISRTDDHRMLCDPRTMK
jgi:hypothetical protein